jgi:hypothetical protein
MSLIIGFRTNLSHSLEHPAEYLLKVIFENQKLIREFLELKPSKSPKSTSVEASQTAVRHNFAPKYRILRY